MTRRPTPHPGPRATPDLADGPRRHRRAAGGAPGRWAPSRGGRAEPGGRAGQAGTEGAGLTEAALVELPKAHLHLHLVGSMRPTTLAEWCRRAGRPTPGLDLGAGGWARFHATYEAASACVGTADDLRRLVDELVEDQAADGARWVEITADPGNYRGRIGPPGHVLDVLLEAGASAAARHGVPVGWVVCANRSRPAAEALALAHLAGRRRGDGVVGFGLANDERAAPTAGFAAAFAVARDQGLRSVPHAGELRGAESVAEAVQLLGADRVGHGVRSLEDDGVLGLLRERRVTLEVCPTSNVALGVYEGGRWGPGRPHPIDRLRAAGVRVCLNADDPLLFGAGLLDEYRFAHRALGWGPGDLAASAATSIEAAGCPTALKRSLLARLDDWSARHA